MSTARFGPWAAGLALCLGVSTQFRLGAVGPGEVMLGLVWLAAAAQVLLGHAEGHKPPLRKTYLALIAMIAVWSWVGLAVSQWMGTTYEGWARQWLALMLAVSFPPLVHAAWGSRFFLRMMGAMATWTVFLFGAAFLTLQTIGERIGPFLLQEFGHRFLGFASDPNQAALVISVAMMALFIVHYRLDWSLRKVAPMVVVLLVMGRATDSDSFLVASGFALLAAVAQSSYDHQGRLRTGMAVAVSVLVMLGIVAILWGLYTQFDALYSKTGQGDTRLRVWSNGIEAWLQSPLAGHGPGHFSGRIAPFGQFEAHNLYIDWAAQFGMVGLFVLIFLIARVALRLIAQREFAGLGMLTVLAALSLFLFFGRHAAFWSGIYCCIVLLDWRREERRVS